MNTTSRKEPIYEATSMDTMSPDAQAMKAIRHALGRIKEDPAVGYYLGLGTETFALLTEAYAALSGNKVRAVREYYTPRDPRNPADPAGREEPEEDLDDGLYEHVEWTARDHLDFTFPLLALQDALAPAGIHIDRIPTGIPGHYEFRIES